MNPENVDQSQPNERPAANGGGTTRQQFQGTESIVQHETAAAAVAAAERAAIESRYIIAMRRPRDWDTVLEKLKKECARPGFADQAIYRKPVGKKLNETTGQWEPNFVEGLSVRFAERALQHMTNVYWSTKSIYDDPSKTISRITVMDLEANVTGETDVTVTKTTEKKSLRTGQLPLSRRTNSYGEVVFIVPATDDEVVNKLNAQASKALRNGALRVLPGYIQDTCEELCRETQAARDKADPDAAKRKLFEAFAGIGIFPDALKTYLGTSAEILLPNELAELRAIYSAIRDGDTTWVAVYEAKFPPNGGGTAEDASANESGKKPATDSAKKVTDIIDKTKARIAEKAATAAAVKKNAEKAEGADKTAKAEGPAAAAGAGTTTAADPAAGSDGVPEPGANG